MFNSSTSIITGLFILNIMAQAIEKRLIESLQADLRNLSNETKRKYPPVKEAAESAIMKIRTVTATPGKSPKHSSYLPSLQQSCSDILQPFLMGCDTKSLPVIQLCFTAMQRLINHDIIDPAMSLNIVNVLWQVFEQNIDELQLRLLQTSLILLTSTRSAVQGHVLSQALVLCFRLHFTKNEVTNNTAEATIRQVVALVFDRVVSEDKENCVTDWRGELYNPKSSDKFRPPKNVSPVVCDAYMLFQDLCQLVNADSPHWLIGITEMTRTFGLELLETVLSGYQSIFEKHPEFTFLLKDRVCALVIRLFSPNIKHRQGAPPPPSGTSTTSIQEKPYFPISMRLLRVVSVLLKKYYSSLVTVSEIFLSLLIKFLDTDKPFWQKALAIEVLQQLCVQPKLLRSFCCDYDMQTHSTKIYRNLVGSLGSFIQNLFMAADLSGTSSQSADLSGNVTSSNSSGFNHSTLLHFEYRGVLIPILPVGNSNGSKYLYREMLDKVEPPPVPDGYILGMAFNAFLDLIRGITSMIDGAIAEGRVYKKSEEDESPEKAGADKITNLNKVYPEMIDATWCGMLTVLSLLLDASTDETTTEAILKCIESSSAVCGQLENKQARDAFITILCKASLPMHYGLPVFNASLAYLPQKIAISSEQQQVLNSSLQRQVVVMGQPLSIGQSSSTNQLSVMLTAKNIQCMRTVINLAHCHGTVMNTAWQIILTTLQHLVWILGLKPATGGQLLPNPRAGSDAASAGSGNNTVLTTAVMTDLPVLSSMLTRLFEASKLLDDVALHHLINALCSLSLEAMDAAYNNNTKEPSLFAIAKLLETGLVNMSRIEILWRPVSGHLLEVCQHPNSTLREWGAEGVTALVKAAINYKHDVMLTECPRMLHMFLLPLKEMSNIPHHDVQRKQLDGTLQLLHSSGDILSSGWPEILSIIGSPTKNSDENLIKTGFRSLQLVVSDFLPSLPCKSLENCIDVVTKYGLQTQDFNISLTAIGLLWSVSDFMYQNMQKIEEGLNAEDGEEVKGNVDSLWLSLFARIGELCVDGRPAVRKSAGQTLFSTISTHGSALKLHAWNQVVWDVLFVLMDNVQEACSTAPNNRSEVSILMHHSRDTAQKQWQETLVLTLAGLSRIFKLKRNLLSSLTDFSEAWEKLFSYLENAALCPSSEVSGAAMCSFEDVLGSDIAMEKDIDRTALWLKAWDTWSKIGIKVTEVPPPYVDDVDSVISQAYLTSFITLFPTLHKHIHSKFSIQCFDQLVKVLTGVIRIPIRWDSAVFEIPSVSKFHLTPLQNAVVSAIDVVQKGISVDSDNALYPAIFKYLLGNAAFVTKPPSYGKCTDKVLRSGKNKWICVNCVPFAEYSMGLVVELYKKTACHKAVILHDVLTSIVKTFKEPISRRYDLTIKTTWQFSVESLLLVLQTGMPVVRQHSQSASFIKLWDEIISCFQLFLFPDSVQPEDMSVEDHLLQESLDVKLIDLIADGILPYSSSMPKSFVIRIIELLGKGSDLNSTEQNADSIGIYRQRDGLSQACFNTMIKFSLVKSSSNVTNGNISEGDETLPNDINNLTLENIVTRCNKSLQTYIKEDQLSLNCPLPQALVQDVMHLLKSMDSLFTSLHNRTTIIDDTVWKLIEDLYPVLVNCTCCSSPELRARVAKLLLHYRPFINMKTLVE